MNTSTTLRILMIGAMLLLVANSASAQSTMATGEFTLQGHLMTSAGADIADGAHTLTANIYSKGSGQVVFTETDNIMTSGGIFSTLIGANGATKLAVDASSDYELGVKIDNEAEMTPKISLTGSLKAVTADLAADANAVGGFGVSMNDNAKANTLLVLNSQGKLSSSLIDSGIVTGINGIKGAVNIATSGDLSATTNGNTLSLAFTGASGSLIYPYTHSVAVASGSAFSLTNTMAGATANFVNSGAGAALSAVAGAGSAISATSTGTASGAATLDIANAGGTAINAVANSATDAAVTIKNTAASANAKLVSALNSTGNAVVEIASSGKTTITSAEKEALNVTTTASGEAALAVNGGLKLVGPAGSGVIQLGQTQSVINNALAKANSIILITVTGGGAAAVPLLVSGQNNGSFVVSVFNGIAALAGNVSFNYLIINQ
jgi:hypothetical protein